MLDKTQILDFLNSDASDTDKIAGLEQQLALNPSCLNDIFFVNLVFKLTSLGKISDLFGTNNTSSNV